jgi:hypothetical protein
VGSGVGAGFELVWLFSLGLVIGMACMFWGFLRLGSPGHATD